MLTSVWNAQKILDDNIRKATLVSTLQDRALTWYMKYSSSNPTAGVAEIQTEVKKEFSWPKSGKQMVVGFKEIVMMLGETPWDLDQKLKSVIHEANMTLTDE